MKKTIRAIVALIATLGMALAGFVGASTALAEDSTGSIIIKNTVAGDKFSLYRILDIESASADCEPNNAAISKATEKALGTDCKVVYKLIENKTLNTALETAAKASANANPETSEEYKKWMNSDDFNLIEASTYMTSKDVDSFAKAFSKEYGTNTVTREVTVTMAGEGVESTDVNTEVVDNVNVTTIDGLTPGYYLIVQDAMSPAATTAKPAEERTKSYNMVGTVLKGKTFTFKLKNGTVELTKKIVEGDNTTDEGVKYAVGDDVTFSLTGTIPANYDQFTKFTYEFTDILPKGLTYNEKSLEVSIVNPGQNPDTITLAEDQKSVEKKDGITTITVKLGDLKATEEKTDGTSLPKYPTITKDTHIVVTYSAKVNENAVYKNENKAKIEFSNNPNSESDTDTASTPEDKSTVFNLTLNVNKTDGDNKPLAGAKFALYREVPAEDADADPTWTPWVTVKDANGDVVTDNEGNPLPKQVEVTEIKKDGKTKSYTASFPGLGEGTYKLVETVTPDGYNTADPIKFTVKATRDNGKVTGFEIDGKTDNIVIPGGPEATETAATETAATATTIVVNKAGSELPSTGGMGAVILYTIGGLIVLAAAAGLTIALKRRQS